MTDIRPTGAASPPTSSELPDGQTALYLDLAPNPVFLFRHLPPVESRAGLAVLLCPPFGWDEVCSYRSRRDWAEDLAAQGHHVVRLDFPGSGDSAGSPRDPGRLDAWTEAIGKAAGWLRSQTDAPRVVAIGIGLGGLVAVRAVSRHASIQDLALWAVPARGRTLVRELDMFARMEVEWSGETPPPDEAGGLTAGGFVVSQETLASLRELDVSKLPLPDLSGRRVLLLERDGLAPDDRLRAALEAAGAAVDLAPGDGYGRMMDDPRWAKAPRSVFATVGRWLGAVDSSNTPTAPETVSLEAAVDTLPTLELTVGEQRISETPLMLDVGGPKLFGVLAEPADRSRADLCAVLLNSGPVRRIGSNRMWVEASRRWAAAGVATVRVDMLGLGDSDGDASRYSSDKAYYEPDLIECTLKLLDALEKQGLPGTFFLAGLCSGAYWSLQAALRDRRVRGAYLINLWSFFWSRSLYLDREAERVRELVRKRQNLRWAAAMWAIGLLRRPLLPLRVRRRRGQIEHAIARLAGQDIQLTLGFSGREPLLADLDAGRLGKRIATASGIRVERFPTGDHTLRAPAYQRQLHAKLDAALERALSQGCGQETGRTT